MVLTMISEVERGSMEGKAEIFNTYYEDDVIRQARGKPKQQWEKSLPLYFPINYPTHPPYRSFSPKPQGIALPFCILDGVMWC